MRFNLPPGVRECDIPGNRPEDVAWDHYWDSERPEFLFRDHYGRDAKENEIDKMYKGDSEFEKIIDDDFEAWYSGPDG